jgi:transcription antitermination factor NusG
MRVAETNHVLKVVTFQGRPAVIREQQIESIRLLLESGIDFDLTNERFKEGDTVEVFAGILQGLRGEVIQIRGAKKLLVRIEQIGSYLVTEIPASSVKSLSENHLTLS